MERKTTEFSGQELRKPDAQGRIAIGKEHADQMYAIAKLADGNILLQPVAVMHVREAWLFANQDALQSVRSGLEDAREGRLHDLGSFAQYADDEASDEA